MKIGSKATWYNQVQLQHIVKKKKKNLHVGQKYKKVDKSSHYQSTIEKWLFNLYRIIRIK